MSGQDARTSCGCGTCAEELPVNPFRTLRVAYGMLLGEDEFGDMMGHPRGKLMLHQAWQHGAGVVWGLGVGVRGTRTLVVAKGLGVDAHGRELRRESEDCRDLLAWLEAQDLAGYRDRASDGVATVPVRVLLRFDCRGTRPVPVLADPCDVTRRHDSPSRVEETARVTLELGDDDGGYPRGYDRVRVLLGLPPTGTGTERAVRDGTEARAAVVARDPADRPAELLDRFRRMAAMDAADRVAAPDGEGADAALGLFEDADPGVTLARLTVRVRDGQSCLELVGDVTVDPGPALLPTSAIQELLCGLAPGLLDTDPTTDQGPRLCDEPPGWDEATATFTLRVTADLHAGTVPHHVRVFSIDPTDPRSAWVDEAVESATWVPEERGIQVEMADPPVRPLVRILVEGTGRHPVLGVAPVLPLAGVVGDPPAGRDGRDGVLMFPNPALPASRPATSAAASEGSGES